MKLTGNLMSPECLSTADPVSHITVELQPHHERGLVRENDTMRWNEKRERDRENIIFWKLSVSVLISTGIYYTKIKTWSISY